MFFLYKFCGDANHHFSSFFTVFNFLQCLRSTIGAPMEGEIFGWLTSAFPLISSTSFEGGEKGEVS